MNSNRIIFSVVLMLYSGGELSATSYPQSKPDLPKAQITLDESDFEVSFGQHVDPKICMQVIPADYFLSEVHFVSDPPGALSATIGSQGGCDSGFVEVDIQSLIANMCVDHAGLSISIDGKTVPFQVDGETFQSLSGDIYKPNVEVAVSYANITCTAAGGSGPGGRVDWSIKVSDTNKSDASFFNDQIDESLSFVSDGCGYGALSPGSGNLDSNSTAVDHMIFCGGTSLANCTTVISQTVSIGGCVLDTHNISYVMTGNMSGPQNFYTTRGDGPNHSTVSSSPIAQ